jgi:hypothetical protein
MWSRAFSKTLLQENMFTLGLADATQFRASHAGEEWCAEHSHPQPPASFRSRGGAALHSAAWDSGITSTLRADVRATTTRGDSGGSGGSGGSGTSGMDNPLAKMDRLARLTGGDYGDDKPAWVNVVRSPPEDRSTVGRRGSMGASAWGPSAKQHGGTSSLPPRIVNRTRSPGRASRGEGVVSMVTTKRQQAKALQVRERGRREDGGE